jgi:hypothetical protein
MDWYVLLLRIVHIGGGIFWAGVALFASLFLEKALKEAGPAGPQVMGALATKTRFQTAMLAASGLAVLSGILLYIRDSGLFQNMAWISSGFGVMMTIGGLAGIAAMGAGNARGQLTKQIGALGAEIGKSGNPPTPEQAAQMKALNERSSQIGGITSILLAITVLCMSIARYVIF